MKQFEQIPELTFNYNKKDNIEFELLEIESLYQKTFANHNPIDPHRVGFFTIIYFEQGSGEHCIDFEYYPFSAGTFICIYPNQVHAWDFTGNPKGKVLILSETFFEQLSANIKVPFNNKYIGIKNVSSPVINPDKESRNHLIGLMGSINFVQNQTDSNPMIALHLYLAFYLLLDRLRPINLDKRLSSKQNQIFSRFIELLQLNCQRIRDASWYANQLHITYKTLNILCKLTINQTAKQLINDYAIVEIKRNLAIGSASIQNLSSKFGFEDVSNFNKFFKKITKLTPRQFQKKFAFTDE